MSYRDQLQAALQRASALERELATLERELAAHRAPDLLEAQVEDLRGQLASAKQTIRELQPPDRLSPAAEKDLGRASAIVIVLCGFGFLALFAIIDWVSAEPEKPESREVFGVDAFDRWRDALRPKTGPWRFTAGTDTYSVIPLPESGGTGLVHDQLARMDFAGLVYPREDGAGFAATEPEHGWLWIVAPLPWRDGGENGSAPTARLAIRAATAALARAGWDASEAAAITDGW